MHFLIYIPLMLIALASGYWTGNSNHTDMKANVDDIVNIKANQQKLFGAMDAGLNRLNNNSRSPASINPIPKKGQWKKRELILADYFDQNDPITKNILEVLIADLHATNPGDNSELHKKLREELKKNPVHSFKKINDLLKKIPFKEYPLEKAALFSLATQELYASPEEVNQMALEELTTNISQERALPTEAKTEQELDIALSTNEQMVLPSVAYDAYIDTVSDPQTAINETVTVLDQQQDYAVRNNIVMSFNDKFPEHSQELETEVATNEIDVLYYQEKQALQDFEAKQQDIDNQLKEAELQEQKESL